MKTIFPYISPLIESQFPSFYREEGPQFITFVKKYYEWLEEANNVLYHTRRLLEYRDIDRTVDDFIVFFKEETLKNVQFNTATNKELLVKNALDLYRSKGTPRSIELFFKLVYGQSARVYYPGDDLFKLSDNTWKIPEYLEVTYTEFNPSYEGRQIRGLKSGASAFVENYAIKKKINKQTDLDDKEIRISKDVYILFITNVKGAFKFGETIVHAGITNPKTAPKIIGSLSEISVITGASNYEIGDIVKLTSNTGFNGKAIVRSVANVTGQVDFTLVDGGWGYTLSPKIIISEKALVVNNVIASSGKLKKPFELFTTLVQPKAYVEFNTYNGQFANNDIVYSYDNGNVSSISRIITISSNGFTGNMHLSVLSGNIPSSGNVLYLSDNNSNANITLMLDRSSTANIMGVSSNNVLTINDINNGIIPIVGEIVFQQNNSLGEWVLAEVSKVQREGRDAYIEVINTHGTFISGQRLQSKTKNIDANLFSYSTNIGIYDTSETSVISVQIQNIGQGYSNGELVTFESEDGFGAVGLVRTYGNGSVSNIAIINGGSGYVTAPIVKIVNTASPVYFNANTNVNEELNFINIPNSGFINAQAIRYTANNGNTSLNGLISGFVYYARVANSTGIQLSTDPSGAVLDLTKGLTENGHSFTAAVSSGNGFFANSVLGTPFDYENDLYVYSVTSDIISFNPGDIGSTNHFIPLESQPFTNGQSVVYKVAQGSTRVNLLSNNSIYKIGTSNSTGITLSYSNGIVIPILPGSSENGHSFAALTGANIFLAGEGSLAEIRVTTLDDVETVELNTDFIGGYNIYGAPYLYIILDGRANSALSGSNSYGFPAKPSGNLTNFPIATMLTKELFSVGAISSVGLINPGDDYTLDPFVTIIEPVVAGYRKYDQTMTIDGDTSRFTDKENILYTNRKAFDGSSSNVSSSFISIPGHPFFNNQIVTYSTETGSDLVGGLQNNVSYYIVSANSSTLGLSLELAGSAIQLTPTASFSKHYIHENNYEKFGEISRIVNSSVIEVKRLTMFDDPDPDSQTFLKGESSQYIVRLINAVDKESYSGLNSEVETDVLIANGSVKTLEIIDSGFAYEQNDIMSFQKENDNEATVGLARGRNSRQGLGSGYFKNSKGFLSQDKYLHDGDFYQEYSYQVISPLAFDRYSEMLKKVLHVAGTKPFGAVELESKNDIEIKGFGKLEITTNFNPTNNVDVIENFIQLPNILVYANGYSNSNLKYANGQRITYNVDSGNTVLIGLSNNETYYVRFANSVGFKLSQTANGDIINFVSPLPNQIGHGIQKNV